MGHVLRCCLSGRISAFLPDLRRGDTLRNVHSISRRLSTSKVAHREDDTPANKSEKTSADKNFLDDILKFKNEHKVTLPRSTIKSDDFVSGPDNDPEIFGTLHKKNPYLLSLHEGSEDDKLEDKFTSELPNYLPQKQYVKMIQTYLRQRRFADALDVLQVTMLKEHRVKPEYYIYAILISHCGRTGYSKMAFKLFNDMKKRGLLVTSSVYTALFNSCANSPYPSEGLKLTRHLFSLMNEKGIEINEINFRAIIKAFGRCGSLEEAFKVVDHMMSKGMALNPETMSFLFHACITDKEAGFRHALLTYKKMIQYQIQPNVYHFNLLLHCLRDCSIGDMESTIDLLKIIGVKNAERLSTGKPAVPQLDAAFPWEEDVVVSTTTVTGSTNKSQAQMEHSSLTENNMPTSLLPNLFAKEPSLGCVVSVAEMARPQDRLLLLGGVEGFLEEMAKHSAEANIKTYCLLLACCPETCTAEESLLKIISKMQMKTDLLFFNTLIKRRIKRKQYSEAKEVLSLIAAHGLYPDLMTYTNIAMTCRTLTDAQELFQAMDSASIRPGIELITAMLGCASCSYQMRYVDFILEVIQYEEMKVNTRFMNKLDTLYESCLRILKVRPAKFSPKSLDAIKNFSNKYPKLKETFQIEEERDPWQHLRTRYQSNSETDGDFLKQTVEPSAFKPKFPRLGPNTRPKIKQAKLKKEREDNPELFSQKKKVSKEILNKLEGLETVVYQKLIPHNK